MALFAVTVRDVLVCKTNSDDAAVVTTVRTENTSVVRFLHVRLLMLCHIRTPSSSV